MAASSSSIPVLARPQLLAGRWTSHHSIIKEQEELSIPPITLHRLPHSNSIPVLASVVARQMTHHCASKRTGLGHQYHYSRRPLAFSLLHDFQDTARLTRLCSSSRANSVCRQTKPQSAAATSFRL